MKKNGIATLKKQARPEEPVIDPTLPGSAKPMPSVIETLEDISQKGDDELF